MRSESLSTTKHALTMLENLPGQMRKGVTLACAKSKRSRFCAGMDYSLFTGEMFDAAFDAMESDSQQEFIAGLEYFCALARAHIKFIDATNK